VNEIGRVKETIAERLRFLATPGDSPWPPYMKPDVFRKSGLWPIGRTALFAAMRLRKFHNFLMMDGLTKQGVRVIDVESALAYLKSLSDQAARGTSPAPTELEMKNGAKRTRPGGRQKLESA
jgi:hypothetical protein